MIRKLFIIFFLIFNLAALFYLVSPSPQLKPLINSAVSDEPGDTTQLKNVAAYYTNQSRTEIINFYKANYPGPFRIQINHPPERSREIIKNTLQSYYFEQFILPFKESLFVNGFEWENDVFVKPEKRIQNKLIFQGKEYKVKVTTKIIPVPIWQRLVAFYGIEMGIIVILLIYYRVIFKK